MKNMCGGNMSRGKCPAQWNCMQRYNVCSLPFPQVHAATKFCSLQDAAALHTLTAPVHHRLVHFGCLNQSDPDPNPDFRIYPDTGLRRIAPKI